jgi:hypothetical protein
MLYEINTRAAASPPPCPLRQAVGVTLATPEARGLLQALAPRWVVTRANL